MRRSIGLLLVVLTFFAPVKRLDIAKLEPVEAIAIWMENGRPCICTDTGSMGRGSDVPEALAELKKNAPSVIYFDTARYLLVADDAWEAAKALYPYLRRTVQTASYHGGDIARQTRYLDAHRHAERAGN